MPIITVNIREGRSVEQKRAMVEGMTKVVCESMKVQPSSVRIIINDMSKENFAIAGVLSCDDPAHQPQKP